MSNTTITFPEFEPNQVLTDSHLNDLRDYLDQEIKWSRTQLTGMGIVCGLELLYQPDAQEAQPKLTIQAGTGITSQGFLVTFRTDCPLRYYRPYELPESEEYAAFQDLTMWELLRNQPEEPDQELPITHDLLKPAEGEMGLVIFLELVDQDHDSCLGRSCDEIGKTRILTVRKLLMSKEDMATLMASGGITLEDDENIAWQVEANDELNLIYPGKLTLPELDVPHILHYPGAPHLTDLPALQEYYSTQMQGTFEKLLGDEGPGALAQTFTAYQPLLGKAYADSNPFAGSTFDTRKAAVMGLLANPTQDSPTPAIQYLYGFLRDLVAAYAEFTTMGEALLYECILDTSRFPRHLMLGRVEAGSYDPCNTDACRHEFIQPPIYNGQRERIRAVRSLFERMRRLWEQADIELLRALPETDDIRVTPAGGPGQALALQSIPYYLHIEEDTSTIDGLVRHWNYQRYRYCHEQRNRSYHALNYSTLSGATSPLSADLAPYNFFKVEGHLGRALDEVQDWVNNTLSNLQLPFSVSWVRLEETDTLLPLSSDCQQSLEQYQANYTLLRAKLISQIHELLTKIDLSRDLPGDLPYDTGSDPYSAAISMMQSVPQELTSFDATDFAARWLDMLVPLNELQARLLYWRQHYRITQRELEDPKVYEVFMENVWELQDTIDEFLRDRFDGQLLTLSALYALQSDWLNTHSTPTLAEAIMQAPANHLAGVHRGGELLMIYHQLGDDPQARVVADLSREQTCCTNCPSPPADLEEALCLPPVGNTRMRFVEQGSTDVINLSLGDLLLDLNFDITLPEDGEEEEVPGYGAGVTITAVNRLSGTALGQIEIAEDGSRIDYTPTAGGDPDTGLDTFAVTLSHESCGTGTAIVSVLVHPLLYPPLVANDNVASTPVTRSVSIRVLENDLNTNANTLLLVPATSPAGARLEVSNQAITYRPALNQTGVDRFNYTLQDQQGNQQSGTAQVTMHLGSADQCLQYTEKNQPVTFSVLGERVLDSDERYELFLWPLGTPSENSIGTLHGDASLSVNEGGFTQITYTPEEDFTGIDTFGVRRTGNAGEVACKVQVLVDCCGAELTPCSMPDITLDHNEPEETLIIDFIESYPGITPLGLGATDLRFVGASISDNRIILATQPDLGYLKEYQLTYTGSDENGQTCSGTITIQVNFELGKAPDYTVNVPSTDTINIPIDPATLDNWQVTFIDADKLDGVGTITINTQRDGLIFNANSQFFDSVPGQIVLDYQITEEGGQELGGTVTLVNTGGSGQTQPTDDVKYTRIDQRTADPMEGFGADVALTDEYLLVGAAGYQSPEEATRAGAAFAYINDGNTWKEAPILQPNSSNALDLAGYAVAKGKELGYLSVPVLRTEGKARIEGYLQPYTVEAASSTFNQMPEAYGVESGYAIKGVCMSGHNESVLLGCYGEEDQNQVGVQVFTRSDNVMQLEFETVLDMPIGSELSFTRWVAMGPDVFAVGQPIAGQVVNGETKKNVLIFRKDKGNWEQVQEISPQSPDDYYGLAVALSEDWLAVGSNTPGGDQGRVYMYRYSSETSRYEEHSILVPKEPVTGEIYGFALDLLRGTLIVSSIPDFENPVGEGNVLIYEYNGTSDLWEETGQCKNPEPETGDVYGISLSLSENYLAVGCGYPPITGEGIKPGKVYVFERSTRTTN